MCDNLRDKFRGIERCQSEALGGRGWEYALNNVLHVNLAESDGVRGRNRVMKTDQRLCVHSNLTGKRSGSVATSSTN